VLSEPVLEERLMKNPFLSIWLSAANTAAGSARAFWTAELNRQQKAIASETARVLSAPASKKRSSAKRRKARPK
jgi:hypothetical protein